MNQERQKTDAIADAVEIPEGATHTLMYDGCLCYFKKVGVHMYQYLYDGFSEKPFSCLSFYNFKPL